MAQQPQVVEKFKMSYPFVDLVFGVNGIDRLPQLIAQRITGHKRVMQQPFERTEIVEDMPIRRGSSFRAWLPIMYGCDNFCSYCIVPYVRGRERSRKSADILAEFRQLVAQGYKDITLLGQNVNSYGKGLDEGLDFADLLAMLDAEPGDYRIRFMTSHPKDATKKLIDTMAGRPAHCAPSASAGAVGLGPHFAADEPALHGAKLSRADRLRQEPHPGYDVFVRHHRGLSRRDARGL